MLPYSVFFSPHDDGGMAISLSAICGKEKHISRERTTK
jgi:hypothetical protein